MGKKNECFKIAKEFLKEFEAHDGQINSKAFYAKFRTAITGEKTSKILDPIFPMPVRPLPDSQVLKAKQGKFYLMQIKDERVGDILLQMVIVAKETENNGFEMDIRQVVFGNRYKNSFLGDVYADEDLFFTYGSEKNKGIVKSLFLLKDKDLRMLLPDYKEMMQLAEKA